MFIFSVDKLRLEIKRLPFPTRMLHNPGSRTELDGESRKRDTRASRLQPWWFDIKNVSISTGDVLNESNIEADRNVGGAEEHQHPKNENLNSALPLELNGHSVPCSSNPYNDPGYGGVWVSSEAQSLVHSHYAAMLPPRMALPLRRAEEPVYVNAKQYHGILRRRQSRAKAELEKKVIRVRRPYLHESRHLHAMKRERGCGGRFLSKNIAERSNREMRCTDGYDSSKASQSRNLYYVDDDEEEPKGFSTRVMNPSKGFV